MGDHGGKHDPAERTEVVLRRTASIRMRRSGMTYQQIADAVPDYHGNKGTAYRDIARALEEARSESSETIEEMRQLADERDNDLRRRCNEIIVSPHHVVQFGKVVLGVDGNPVRDHMPVLQAMDRLGRIEERYARRHGLDQADKIEIAFSRRTDEESSAVVEAILAGFDALGLPVEQRLTALEAAQRSLDGVVDGEVVSETTEDL